MQHKALETPSKKVAYLELVYDLIFVYLLDRNNALLALDSDGFFTAEEFHVYFMSTLIILQIWAFSVMFINRYGENKLRDHIFLFINMYLLYYMAVDTRLDWRRYHASYNTAWALILLNLFVQYILQGRKLPAGSDAKRLTLTRAFLYLLEACIIFVSIPIFRKTGTEFEWLPLLVGFLGPIATNRIEEAVPVSFDHLTERVMLFVVFTFGEMVVGLSAYFDDGPSFSTFYFSCFAFLITVCLCMSYGFLYNHVMNRHRRTNGKIFLLLHIFIVAALNDISVGLESMRESASNPGLMQGFIAVSLFAYYAAVLLVTRRTEFVHVKEWPFAIPSVILSAGYAGLVAILYLDVQVTIALTAAYTCAMLLLIVLRWKVALKRNPSLNLLVS